MQNRNCIFTRGFTLIELLVALVIFAIISALSYRSLSALLQTKERIESETSRWREVMIFFNRLDTDLHQSVNRGISVGKGSSQAPFIGNLYTPFTNDVQLRFSRLGVPDQYGVLIDTQRIGYRYNAGKIELLVWPALDIQEATKPKNFTVLSGVRSMTLHYMQHKDHRWVSTWPSEFKEETLPKAVEIEVVLNTGEKLNRIYHLQ